jgi:hypothetical protein
MSQLTRSSRQLYATAKTDQPSVQSQNARVSNKPRTVQSVPGCLFWRLSLSRSVSSELCGEPARESANSDVAAGETGGRASRRKEGGRPCVGLRMQPLCLHRHDGVVGLWLELELDDSLSP